MVIAGPGSPKGLSSSEAWRRVVLTRPEQFPVALLLTAAGSDGERLLGLGIRQEGWLLQSREPALVLGQVWREVIPELAKDLEADLWTQAWRSWCQPRGLPTGEVDACRFQYHSCRLRVLAPSRLIERLRALRSDVLKNEAWLLAGAGRLRTAARVELADARC